MKTIRTVVIEDEAVTARNLIHLLGEIAHDIDVVSTLSSVEEAINWFTANESTYDLIFMDIRLADGLSFDIFKQINIDKPVIFVTAYNDYAIAAFKNNGIDYILKPFDEEEIANAVNKYKRWIGSVEPQVLPVFADLLAQIGNRSKSYKKSFLIHYRDKLIPVETAKISWFYTANEIVYARTMDDRQYVMDFTIEQLEQQLEPDSFFRANRQFIINRQAITEVEFYFNGRLLVKVKPIAETQILISKARVPEFKRWMNT
ncbi:MULTISPECIES: LytR/AlgR family response regulator transcription factor [unclassified Pedobacter]|uniref:LytR/AlgR family response regulator transcription factor n=1 Tax=unclassified Pedobacter TaxID=2628915 RepID=UPI0014214E90|nr:MULTISPECIES: LytTR family DNA-binding domain-containing protein [unclassified Pedobacter]NII83739.1 DNA-binding LytR/AlgR family response regulator [Pedobacter sp. SG908]NMN37596.1 DNA-binding LytR/AlgR family response regulator [Pedobacter sp. SG918]